MVESMCVVCHGPVALKPNMRQTSIVCGENCNATWHHHLKKGGKLFPKYAVLREMQEFRRDQMAFAARFSARFKEQIAAATRATRRELEEVEALCGW